MSLTQARNAIEVRFVERLCLRLIGDIDITKLQHGVIDATGHACFEPLRERGKLRLWFSVSAEARV
jgi:hypothetical protein